MDNRRSDVLTRIYGDGISRRHLVRSVGLGTAAAGVLGLLGLPRCVRAATPVATYTTARAAYQTAIAAALAEDPETRFVGATGVEASHPDQFVEAYGRDHSGTAGVTPEAAANPTQLYDAAILFFSVPAADPDIGDGRAPAWLFSFVGPTGERVVTTFGTTVTFNRAVPGTAPTPAEGEGTGGEAAWRLDSDQMTHAVEAIPHYVERRRQASLAVHVLSLKAGQAPLWNTSLLGGDVRDRDWEWGDVLIDMSGTIVSRGRVCGRTKESCQR